MEFDEAAEEYYPSDDHEMKDIEAVLELLETFPANSVVAWRNRSDGTAWPGLWIKRGKHKIKHGSFVCPEDLSCYGAQYYVEDDARGMHDCLRLGHGGDKPDDAIAISNLQELLDAIDHLVFGEDVDLTDGPDEARSEKLNDLKIISPARVFEMHGAITRGWEMQVYKADVEEEVQHIMLVFD